MSYRRSRVSKIEGLTPLARWLFFYIGSGLGDGVVDSLASDAILFGRLPGCIRTSPAGRPDSGPGGRLLGTASCERRGVGGARLRAPRIDQWHSLSRPPRWGVG